MYYNSFISVSMLQGQHPISAAKQFSPLRKEPRSTRHIIPLLTQRGRPPRRAPTLPFPTHEELMDSQAADYLGTHDFSAFCSANSDVRDKVRTVTQCEVRRLPENKDMIEFTVTADGFLYNMVRIMVGTLLQISAGRMERDTIPSIIASKDRNRAGFTADACGLYLNKVLY